MNEKQQILYMKIRLIRLYAERNSRTIAQAATDLLRWGVLDYVDGNFDLFHIQGDEAVYEDICEYIKNTGGVKS